jgi:hypothetical protein
MTSIIFLQSLDFQYIRHTTFQSKKTKRLDAYSLFVREYLQIYRGNEIIQKSSFLKRLQNYLYAIRI